MQLEKNNTKKFPRNPSRIKAKKTASSSKVGSKWHEKYAAGNPAIVSRELANQQENYTIQDPGTVKWQETYARPETAKLENGKEETKETVKLIAREKKQKKPTDST